MSFTFIASAYPDGPGVYLMKDTGESILYVGKAKSLKKRLSQYFQDHASRQDAGKIHRLVALIHDIETISTNTEREALLLENELIKQHKPPFNTRMKDDKSYPYIMLTTSERFPRVAIIRGTHLYPKSNTFFGPYTDKKSVIRILKHLRTIFLYCSCKSCVKGRGRACLYHHMNHCPAPCKASGEDGFHERYMENINGLAMFLRGDHAALLAVLHERMEATATRMAFEVAALYRDKITALEKMFKPQSVLSLEWKDVDVIGTASNEDEMIILVMEVRDARLAGKVPFIYDLGGSVNEDTDIIEHFLVDYYNEDKVHYPHAVIVHAREQLDLRNAASIITTRSRNVIERVEVPVDEGELLDLATMARKNAFFLLHKRKVNRDLASFDHVEALADLAVALGLKKAPVVVEGYDISNIQGKHATGSKVSFKDGKPHKSGYRRYRIKSGDGPDDVRMMGEIICRRFTRVASGQEAPPDLILVDGGKGQLNAAMEQLRALGLDHLSAIGLAKREEEIFLPGLPDPVVLPADSKALLFLQRVRDESHRFAVKYHRVLAGGQIDELDKTLRDLPGIGEKRAKALRTTFKTLDSIKAASVEELQAVTRSRKVAELVHGRLHGEP